MSRQLGHQNEGAVASDLPHRPPPFTLEKWYFDGADRQGTAFIAYRAALSWRQLSINWQSVTTYSPTSRASRVSLRKSAAPSQDGDSIRWSPAPLRATFQVTSHCPRIVDVLWTEPVAASAAPRRVEWSCAAPVATVRATLAKGPFTGVGYAERLTMTTPPWRLPLRQLRWGRWGDHDARHSLVWIEWVGASPLSRIYLDGMRVAGEIGATRILGDHFTLDLAEGLTLEQRRFADVVRGVPRLTRLLPRAIRDMREDKWLSSGVLRLHDGRHIPGTSIHEVVTMG